MLRAGGRLWGWVTLRATLRAGGRLWGWLGHAQGWGQAVGLGRAQGHAQGWGQAATTAGAHGAGPSDGAWPRASQEVVSGSDLVTVTRVSHGPVMARQARGEVAGLEAELGVSLGVTAEAVHSRSWGCKWNTAQRQGRRAHPCWGLGLLSPQHLCLRTPSSVLPKLVQGTSSQTHRSGKDILKALSPVPIQTRALYRVFQTAETGVYIFK